MSPDSFQALYSNFWSVFLILVMFGGSIFVHELGHFLAARRRGLKIERFSIGFGPKIFAWERAGVEYRIAILPFGGYVALPQLADMGALEGGYDETAEALPPIGFTDKFIVAVMGAVFNLIFAFILACALWATGQPSSEQEQTTVVGHVARTLDLNEGTTVEAPGFTARLQPGDQVISIDGNGVSTFSALRHTLITGSGRDEKGNPKAVFEVERDGQIMEIEVFPRLVEINPVSGERIRRVGISPAYSLIVQSVKQHSPAEAAGIQPGDQVLAVDGEDLYSYHTLIYYLEDHHDRAVTLTVKRGDATLPVVLQAEQVAFTKPLGKLEITDNRRHATLLLQPFYEPERKEGLTDPTTPSRLEIHETEDPTSFVFGQLVPGDVISRVNGRAVGSLQAWLDAVNAQKEATLSFTIVHGQDIETAAILGQAEATLSEPEMMPDTGMRFTSRQLIIHLNPWDQFAGIVTTTLQVLGSLVSPNSDIGIRNLSGPPGIIRVIHEFSRIDIRLVLWFVCLLNINLAILNLLPIPVLDGGHIAFAAVARLRGRSLPPGLVAGTQGIFMVLLFSMMIYVSFFDVRRWQGDNESQKRFELQNALYIEPQFGNATNKE